MAGEMGKPDYQEQDRAYMEGAARPLESYGSVLMTNSRFLNSAKMRDVYAQEGLRKDGRDVPATYMVHQAAMAIGELTDTAEVERLIAAEKAKNPEFAAWLDKRSLSDFTLEDLKDFAPDTLGGIVHNYLFTNGFDLNHSKRGLVPTTDYTFMQKQRVVSHDIEHIVSGLGPNLIGEHALIACNMKCNYDYFSADLACELVRMSGFLMSTGVMKINLHSPHLMSEYFKAITIGVNMANGMTRPLLVNDWRDYLDWTLEEIREELNIVGAQPAGTWEWTNEASRGDYAAAAE
jgi:ubiquinone biosynthesis protein Coq4